MRDQNPIKSSGDRLLHLTEAYRWKAENIVRFFEKLEMTTKQKEDFLAWELGSIHWVVEISAPSVRHM